MTPTHRALIALAALTLPAMACDDTEDTGEGTLAVSIYGEEFIEEGIPPGEPGCDGCVEDGWAVTFDRFLVTVTALEARGPATVRDETARVFDLALGSGGDGHPVVDLPAPAGHYHQLDYTLAPAASAVAGNATADDVALMTGNGFSVYVEGTATRDATTKTFAWGFTDTARYTDCEIDAPVPDAGAAAAELTIHADHLLYDDLDSGEPRVVFDLLAASDTDDDGLITPEELAARDISAEARYQVGSRPITDLWAFVAAQTLTLGHIDGEGHCDQQ